MDEIRTLLEFSRCFTFLTVALVSWSARSISGFSSGPARDLRRLAIGGFAPKLRRRRFLEP